ncbi:hypothetical protein BDZ89DRAFT_1152586 [Hymenopellis radicata]|nr:hypothetical protein BDZ89DRAFT_1152586 [Hymenopellis radicata]
MASPSTTTVAATQAESGESQIMGIDLVGAHLQSLNPIQLGVKGLEVVELYDIEPLAVDHLHPHGLIFCFLWHKDTHRPGTFDDPASECVWFANQLSDDACASQAILKRLIQLSRRQDWRRHGLFQGGDQGYVACDARSRHIQFDYYS